MNRPFAKFGDMSESLLKTVTETLTEENEKNKIYEAILETYGVTTPFELSEELQDEVYILVSDILGEKYIGFEKLKKKISARGGVRNPAAVAASIGRKKYGKERFQAMAAAGKKSHMKEASNEAPNIQRLTLTQETHDLSHEKAMKEMDMKERTAFHMTAASAAKSGQPHFEFGGKKFKTTMSKDVAHKMTEEPMETMKQVKMVHQEESKDETPPFDPDKPREKRPDEPTTAKGLARQAMRQEIEKIKQDAKDERKRLRKSLREPMRKVEEEEERHMTPGEMKKREKIAKSMKPVSDWEKRYPGRGKEVMYATATKQAMKEEIEVKEKSHAARIKELVKKKGRSMKENNVKGGKTMTGQSKDQVDMEPVHKDGIMSGAGVKSGA